MPIKPYEPKLTHKERAERRRSIAEFVKGGRSRQEAAAKFGVAYDTVTNACREYSIIGPQGTAPRTMEVVATLLYSSLTILQTAAHHLISQQRVREIFNQARTCGIRFPHRKVTGAPKDPKNLATPPPLARRA